MITKKDIKTIKDGNFYMLQYKGNTLQGIWKRQFKDFIALQRRL